MTTGSHIWYEFTKPGERETFRLVPSLGTLFRQTERVPLTPSDFDLLELLVSNPTTAYSLDDIIDAVRGKEHEGAHQTFKHGITVLREALDKTAIVNVRGKGYYFGWPVTPHVSPPPTDAPPPLEDLLAIPRRVWDGDVQPPGVLLRADCSHGVPFHGRTAEETDLETWCHDGRPLAIRLYTAAGGMGKTRLFLELCDTFKLRGWRAGFLRSAVALTPAMCAGLRQEATPLLVVIDYAETRRPELITLLSALSKPSATRARLILLARSAGDWWDQLKGDGTGVGDLLSGPATRWHELRPLAMTTRDREVSYRKAVQTFAAALKKSVPDVSTDPDFAAPYFDRVLLLHMTALAAVDGDVVKGADGILDWILRREYRFWSEQVKTNALAAGAVDGVAQAMAVITLGGGVADRAEAHEILARVPLLKDQNKIARRAVATILHETYPGQKWIEPILPDLLGEHLVKKELDKDETGVLSDLVFGPEDMEGESKDVDDGESADRGDDDDAEESNPTPPDEELGG